MNPESMPPEINEPKRWEIIAVIPKPIGAYISLVALILGAISAGFEFRYGLGPWAFVLIFALCVRSVFNYHKSLVKNTLEVETDGVRLRVKVRNEFADIVEITKMGLIRKDRSWYLYATFVLRNGESVTGDMFAPSRFHIPIRGTGEYLNFIKPIMLNYDVVI